VRWRRRVALEVDEVKDEDKEDDDGPVRRDVNVCRLL
jgi:hypothetical protein